jgi:hypothetical protein
MVKELSVRPHGKIPATPPDAGSRDAKESLGPLEALISIPAALAAAASFEAAARKVFGGAGWSDVIVPVLSLVGLMMASVHLVRAEETIPSMLVRGEPCRKHRYHPSVRMVGKVGLIATLVLLPLRLWDIRPNFIGGDGSLEGFLCFPGPGTAIPSGFIRVISRSGSFMSAAEKLDDRGYFYCDLDRISFRPAALRFDSPNLSGPCIISLDASRRGTCLGGREESRPPRGFRGEWMVSCQK